MNSATSPQISFISTLTTELIDHAGDDLRIINAARVSTSGAMKTSGDDATSGLINRLMKDRHGSPFEQGWIQLRVHAPIFVFREWHRHRIGISINEESGRYRELEPVFYVPPAERPLAQVGKAMDYNLVEGEFTDTKKLIRLKRYKESCTYAYEVYQMDLRDGVAKEVARMVLPVSIYSSMYYAFNPRSLMAFLSLRTNHPEATFPSKPQWEIAKCADQIEAIFAEHWPITHAAFVANGRVAP